MSADDALADGQPAGGDDRAERDLFLFAPCIEHLSGSLLGRCNARSGGKQIMRRLAPTQSVLFAGGGPPKLRRLGKIRKGARSMARLIGGRMARLHARFRCAHACGARIRTRRRRRAIPSKNLTIIVSIGAGTGMDVLVRLYAEKLSAALGKPVVVENKPGAATMLAAAQVATAPPDGHTLVVLTSAAMAINPCALQADQLQSRTGLRADFALREIAVHPGGEPAAWPPRPCRSSSSTPRKPSRRSTTPRSGAGALQHLSMEFAKQRFGFDATHVPYRDTGQSVTDLAAGHVAVGFVEAGASIPLIKDGRLRALAVSASSAAAAAARRAAVLGSRRRAGLRGGVLAHPAGAVEDAEGDRRPAARRDEEDHGRAGDEGEGVRHRPDPDRHAVGRRHANDYIKSERVKWGTLVEKLGLKGSQ